MSYTAGAEPVTAPGIHDGLPTDAATRNSSAQLQAKLKSRTQAIRWHLMADVLYAVSGAVSGIPLLGPAVGHALANWADDLEQRATDALNDSAVAQSTATYATTQVTVLATTVAALGTAVGASITDEFGGESASTLGSNWIRTSFGSGAGGFGPNGSGIATWKKSGTLTRSHLDQFATPINTDYQIITTVLATRPETDIGFDTSGATVLIARCNIDATTYVWARIGSKQIAVGKTVAGVVSDPFATYTAPDGGGVRGSGGVTYTVGPGDQIAFIVGTDVSARHFIVKQNGVVRINHVDVTSSAYGEDYLYAGLMSSAVHALGSFTQLAPAELSMWSAADRSATDY